MNKYRLEIWVAKGILILAMAYLVWAIVSDHSMETCLQRHSSDVCSTELR